LYYQEGITLKNGATVFDVGANVGSFALWVNNKFKGTTLHNVLMTWKDCNVLCFEPIPPTYKILSKNKDDNACMKNAKLFNYGLSSEPVPNITFTYFPTIPGNSTMFLQEKVASWDSADVDATIALFEGPLYWFFVSNDVSSSKR
jgi:FkbM family methyltransferase